MNPVYHQICLSGFVSRSWIGELWFQDIINSIHNASKANLSKAHSIAPHFLLLKVLCDMTHQTTGNALRVFFESPFVGSQVIRRNIFDSQINLLIEDWKSNTAKTFERTIELIQATNEGNKLMNEMSNGGIEIDEISGESWPRIPTFSNCSCDLDGSCRSPLGVTLIGWRPNFFVEEDIIPNFFVGCFPIEALLQSTLECFYNRTCMKVFNKMNVEDNPDEYSILNESLKSPANETIRAIVNRLMVDEWQLNVSFSSYYNACSPFSCTFEYTSRRNSLIFITIVSGLSTGLQILFVICLRLIEKIVENVPHFGLMEFVKNIFSPRNEQQIANRLHIVLLVTTLSIISFVTFITLQSKTDSIDKPLLSDYESIITTRFSESLHCPCSQISIKYESFVTIVPHFHHVCTSDFVTDRWIKYVYDETDRLTRFSHTDFRSTAVSQFQFLASLCQLSEDTVNNALSQFKTTDHINVQRSTPDALTEQIQRIIHEFQLTTSNSFRNTLDLIRETTGSNKLMSVLSTNWKFISVNVTTEKDGNLSTIPLEYEGCNCGLSSKCIHPSRGMMAGCYPIEALLQSTLKCFYDQQCIDSNQMFKSINSSLATSTRFLANATIELILNQLMVENYSTNISYEKYFDECAPLSCSHSYFVRRSAIDIIISLISIYDGLTIISEWIVTIILLSDVHLLLNHQSYLRRQNQSNESLSHL
jgi:hypothetical protein